MSGYHNVDLGDRLTSFQFFYASRNVIRKVYLPTFVMDLRESRENNVREEDLLYEEALLQESSSVVKSDQLSL